ncbi:MAG: nucleotidyltransferase domain-containing protein [Candidatus Jordarchaeaceae archaeon]
MQLDSEVQVFVFKAIREAITVYGLNLISVYVFGSAAKGGYCKQTSDVDLLFIINETCPNELIALFEKNMERLELEEGILVSKDADSLLWKFSRNSAMFKSHFTLRIQSVLSLAFRDLLLEGKCFNLILPKMICKVVLLFTPSVLVVKNMFREAQLLYGKDVLRQIRYPPLTSTDVAKVFITSFLISVFGAISSVFSASSTRFSLEAMKWYVINLYSLINNRTASVEQSLKFAELHHFFPPSRLCCEFRRLRNQYKKEIMFNFSLPLYLIYAHYQFLRYLNKQKIL